MSEKNLTDETMQQKEEIAVENHNDESTKTKKRTTSKSTTKDSIKSKTVKKLSSKKNENKTDKIEDNNIDNNIGTEENLEKSENSKKPEQKTRVRHRSSNKDHKNTNQNDSDSKETETSEKQNNKKDSHKNSNKNNNEKNKSEEAQLYDVAGIVDMMDNYAFLRTSGYLPDQNDVYISNSVIRKFGLRYGDHVVGKIKEVKTTQNNNPKFRQPKFNPLQIVEAVNGMSVEESLKRPKFKDLTPLYPQDRLIMELPQTSTSSKSAKTTARMIDLVAPIGKGQRALIVAPPKAGKTIMMQQIANSISENNPDVHLMVVLVDERPEEVTDMQRSVNGEVLASTFDRPAVDHTTIAELAIERAKRLVEMGQDVVILLDSLTRLARAYNYVAPVSGRILSGGVDAAALYPPKKFLGAARNIEEGGSLTIIASALVETGSKMDEVIFEEFKGTGNAEIKLDRELADKRIFPAINVTASGTRREEWLINPEELKIVYTLNRILAGMEKQQATEMLINKIHTTTTNIEFLMQIKQGITTTGKNLSQPEMGK
ncbi:MAG: transcription termination factor Rho [Candidatus Ancillula sp.]|jgi:transcription termination factor Rho|nr:transcription termination factor Rho [Candidatus Ancillula sp.]